jgi:hypothetical protein
MNIEVSTVFERMDHRAKPVRPAALAQHVTEGEP